MCVSLFPATFSDTLLCLTATKHPVTGLPVHSLLYRNTAENMAPGGAANAMLLHFPAVDGMTKENVIDTSDFPECADDIVRTVTPPRPVTRSFSLSKETSFDTVEVFEHDIYHIALARNAAAIPAALDRVPERKRPMVNGPLFRWYGETFPDYTFALCCFSQEDAETASPLLWWYSPMSSGYGMLPGVDAHTGENPDLSVMTDVDHWVVLGSDRKSAGLKRVRYSDDITARNRAFLPAFVAGRRYRGRERNADFVVPVTALMDGNTGVIERRLLTN